MELTQSISTVMAALTEQKKEQTVNHFKDEMLALLKDFDERKRLISEKCTTSKAHLEESLKITA